MAVYRWGRAGLHLGLILQTRKLRLSRKRELAEGMSCNHGGSGRAPDTQFSSAHTHQADPDPECFCCVALGELLNPSEPPLT